MKFCNPNLEPTLHTKNSSIFFASPSALKYFVEGSRLLSFLDTGDWNQRVLCLHQVILTTIATPR